MILAAVDDLLFASKIRAAAARHGVKLELIASTSGLLERARRLKPTLIVFDLDSRGIQTVPAVTALKADRELATIRTLLFVSHVRADLILAARSAGADEVVARSAFMDRLGVLLSGSRDEGVES